MEIEVETNEKAFIYCNIHIVKGKHLEYEETKIIGIYSLREEAATY